MSNPTDRFTFAGATVRSQPVVTDGKPLFFIDVLGPTDDQAVTIGWSADRTGFGVYVNGVQVHPQPEEEPT